MQKHNIESIILNIFSVMPLLGQKELLVASPLSPSFPPVSSCFTCGFCLYTYMCERLRHAAAPPGCLGDSIGLGDFGFPATAVKLHSDDESVVQLCLRLTLGCWCLCGSVQG